MWRSTCDEEYVGETKTRSLRHSLSRRGARNRSDSPATSGEWEIGAFLPSSIAKSRLATPFRVVLDGLSFFGGRAIVPTRNKRGTCVTRGIGLPLNNVGVQEVEIRNTWWERQFAGGLRSSLPIPAGFRPAFSLLRPVVAVFGAHCTISYENGSANYRPRRRAPRSFSRCKCVSYKGPVALDGEKRHVSPLCACSRRCTCFS